MQSACAGLPTQAFCRLIGIFSVDESNSGAALGSTRNKGGA